MTGERELFALTALWGFCLNCMGHLNVFMSTSSCHAGALVAADKHLLAAKSLMYVILLTTVGGRSYHYLHLRMRKWKRRKAEHRVSSPPLVVEAIPAPPDPVCALNHNFRFSLSAISFPAGTHWEARARCPTVQVAMPMVGNLLPSQGTCCLARGTQHPCNMHVSASQILQCTSIAMLVIGKCGPKTWRTRGRNAFVLIKLTGNWCWYQETRNQIPVLPDSVTWTGFCPLCLGYISEKKKREY